jgi:alkanesulfonate monooxygenase SsuD/methylene tetrahydromethanopterin reductase-like flavin-dependent oxidoreductase (luciferase family)
LLGVRVGITLLTDLPWSEARPRWQAVEDMGFDHAWTYDHLVWGGLPDSPWTTATPVLAAAAQVTSRIGLGTLVASPNFRHPYLLFRDAQALEDLSDGRFLLGVGTGGDLDSGVLGQPPLTVGQRVERFQEFTRTLVALRDGDHVTRLGQWFSTSDARTLPTLHRTPLLVAANGPRSLRFAAAVGDGWVTTGPYAAASVEEWWAGVAAAVATYDEALAGTDRGPTPRYLLSDSPDRFALSSRGFFEEVAGRAAELGFTDLVTHWPRAGAPYAGDPAVLEEVAREVLPGLDGR